jgi:8-oxo-dGTP pyrophosphatase MutT (NUDIX family)
MKKENIYHGFRHSGEDYLDCARREIGEELGIVVDQPLQVLFKLPAGLRTGNEHCMVYRYCFDGPLVLQADEIDDGEWVDAATMDRRVAMQDPVLTDVISLIWKRYRELPVRAG